MTTSAWCCVSSRVNSLSTIKGAPISSKFGRIRIVYISTVIPVFHYKVLKIYCLGPILSFSASKTELAYFCESQEESFIYLVKPFARRLAKIVNPYRTVEALTVFVTTESLLVSFGNRVKSIELKTLFGEENGKKSGVSRIFYEMDDEAEIIPSINH